MFCIIHKTTSGKIAVLDKEDYVIDYITEHELVELKEKGFKFYNVPELRPCATLYGDLIKERTLRGSFESHNYKLVYETLVSLKRYMRGMKVPSNLYDYNCKLVPVTGGFIFLLTMFEPSLSKDYIYMIREDGIFWLEDWRIPNNSTLSVQSWETLVIQFLSNKTFGLIKGYVLDKHLNIITEDTTSYIIEQGGIKNGWII